MKGVLISNYLEKHIESKIKIYEIIIPPIMTYAAELVSVKNTISDDG